MCITVKIYAIYNLNRITTWCTSTNHVATVAYSKSFEDYKLGLQCVTAKMG